MAARTTKPKSTENPEPPFRELINQAVSRTDEGRVFVTSNRFSVAQVEVRHRELLAVAPTNHVGPAPILVPIEELNELIADLVALRDAPADLKDDA